MGSDEELRDRGWLPRVIYPLVPTWKHLAMRCCVNHVYDTGWEGLLVYRMCVIR